MDSVVIPFLLSLFLGRTIDLRTYKVGVEIYDDVNYEESELNTKNSTYYILQDESMPYNFMGLPIDIALRIKSDDIKTQSGTMGLDGLLKQTAWKTNSVVLAVATEVQTVKRTLKKDAPLLSDWKSRIDENQTHYVHSVYYGGWNVIIVQFKCEIPGDVEIVRNTLTSAIGVTGPIEENAVELWRKALLAIMRNEEIRGEITVKVYPYSTKAQHREINDAEDLLDAIKNFSSHLGKVGLPFYAELRPLHSLDPSFPIVKENHEIDDELEKLDVMYDDVQIARSEMTQWLTHSLTSFDDEDETKVTLLLEYLNYIHKKISTIAKQASIYINMDQQLIRACSLLYKYGLHGSARTYQELIRKIKEDIDADCKNSFHHKIKGTLKVKSGEVIDLGHMMNGLKQCKQSCLRDNRCRSIGYAGGNEQTFGINRCFIYYRSSSTAVVKHNKWTYIYDRFCH